MKAFIFIILLIPNFLLGQSNKLSLYYENDAYELQENHIRKIDSLKQLLVHKDSITIRIEGYTNAYGTDKYNLQLSQNRAAQVASLFKSYVVLEVEGYGELENVSSKSRRVDVFINRQVLTKEREEITAEVVEEDIEEPLRSQTTVDLSKLVIGDKVVLKGILFQGGTDIILPESELALKQLYTFLDTTTVQIKLIGHICCNFGRKPHQDGRNSRTGRNRLSKDRAKAIYSYLIDRGISKDRLSHEGRAYLEPLGKGNKYDRRVEIEIIE